MDRPAGQISEGTGRSAHARLITDKKRHHALQHVEGLHVLGMPMKRNALPATGLLVHEAERSSRAVPGGEKEGGRLTHPPQLTLSGLVEVRAGCVIHSPKVSPISA